MTTNTKKLERNGFVAKQLTFGAMALTLLGAFALSCTDEENMTATGVQSTRSALGNSADTRHGFHKHEMDRRYHSREGREARRDGRGHRDNRGHKRGRNFKGHTGGDGWFRVALDQSTLTDDQRTQIQAIANTGQRVRPDHRGHPENGLRTTLAAAMRAGALDESAVTAHFEQKRQAREAKTTARAESLGALHDALEPAQRRAMVEAIKARSAKWNDATDNDKGRHRKTERHGQQHGTRDGSRFKKGGDRVLRLAYGLDLSEAQMQAIDALREAPRSAKPSAQVRDARRSEMKACRDQFLESFASDSFDATTGRCQKRTDEERQVRASQYTETVNALIAILTDAQRTALADKLERAPKRRPRRS